MLKVARTGKLVLQLLFAVAVWNGGIQTGHAQVLTDPALVVDQYLVGLMSGDTQQILTLIDGHMLRKNGQLVNVTATYPQFLRDIYAGVQTTVEEITAVGDKLHARVRFDYPTTSTSEIVFILTNTDSGWKITDEDY